MHRRLLLYVENTDVKLVEAVKSLNCVNQTYWLTKIRLIYSSRSKRFDKNALGAISSRAIGVASGGWVVQAGDGE